MTLKLFHQRPLTW